MRFSFAVLALLSLVSAAAFGQRGGFNFSGIWKLESSTSGARNESRLELVMEGQTVTGTLKLPYGEFPIENGHAEGDDVFFNVTVKREEYVLKTTYRGHRFDQEIQFTVEAGERVMQLIARRLTERGES
jgi:hypothetical protein